MQIRSVTVGGERLDYFFDVKRIKNINLRVRRDGSVYVSAGVGISPLRADAFVAEKAKWIARRRAEIAERSAVIDAVRFRDGATILFLGDGYVVHAMRGKRGVRLRKEEGIMEASLPDPDDGEALNSLLERWFRARAEEVLPVVFEHAEKETAGYFGASCGLVLRKMRARWGSCFARERKITLNTALVHAPVECIAYVCLHELTHLQCPRHDGQFYAVLTRFCPDCRALRRKLNALVAPYIGK